jgi:hypothetical protein
VLHEVFGAVLRCERSTSALVHRAMQSGACWHAGAARGRRPMGATLAAAVPCPLGRCWPRGPGMAVRSHVRRAVLGCMADACWSAFRVEALHAEGWGPPGAPHSGCPVYVAAPSCCTRRQALLPAAAVLASALPSLRAG